MQEMKHWTSNFDASEPRPTKFECFRCNTKNTHGTILADVRSYDDSNEDSLLCESEIFSIIQCSTCGAVTIRYTSYKVPSEVFQLVEEKGINSIKSFNMDLKEDKYFPVIISPKEIPSLVKDDYNLMHACYLIKSHQGVAVHYRRMLDIIFSEYEKKYLSQEEKKMKRIEERAKKISEKDLYFKVFNETIKDLKGIVSSIIHSDIDNLELMSDLNINQEDFEQLDRIILSLIKVYELEFQDLPAIKDKSKRISELKNKND